jgi:hypothetical protein
MRRDRSAARANLRAVIEALPRHTRVAMLTGIERNEIIAGAYSHGDGVCPMLAAHRAGGRTTAIAFAKAWDRFAFRNVRRRQPRRATKRELMILKMYLQASLLAAPAERAVPTAPKPARATPEPAAIARATPMPTAPALTADGVGGEDRSPELAGRPGWSWTRLVRRYDDYERLLALLESELEVASEPDGSAALTR